MYKIANILNGLLKTILEHKPSYKYLTKTNHYFDKQDIFSGLRWRIKVMSKTLKWMRNITPNNTTWILKIEQIEGVRLLPSIGINCCSA